MIKRFLLWLVSIYFKPAPAAETPIPGVTKMTDQVVDVAAQADVATATAVPVQTVETATPAAQPVVGQPAPASTEENKYVEVIAPGSLAAFKSNTAAFIAFVEHGIFVLGEEAEAELVALKDKYL